MDKFALTTTAYPGASRKLAKAAVSILAESIRDWDLIYSVDLALTEACANVVRHAYGGREPGRLQITLSLEPGHYVELEVADWGCGFGTCPKHIENATPEAEGGRGLYIMHELADEFKILKNHNKNIVFLKISVQEELWMPYK